VADELNDDVDFVELASLRTASQLPESVATVLSIQPRADATAAERIVDAVGSRRRLIVLDNCEHVIEEAARLVDEVVRAAPNVTFLATTREPLNIDAEIVVRVQPLDADEAAIELFADRAAGLVRSAPGSEMSRSVVRDICRSLDGLPLAIELAAAQLGSMTLEEIAAGVDEPLEMLQRGRRTADERHRSLRNLIRWSVRELDEPLRAVFSATAAFAGPFSASAVAAVGGFSRSEAGAALADLVDGSLVVVDRSGPLVRFRTLETIRAYAVELLLRDPGSRTTSTNATASGCWVWSPA
jgi:non-specific serine/threonine protein kinase